MRNITKSIVAAEKFSDLVNGLNLYLVVRVVPLCDSSEADSPLSSDSFSDFSAVSAQVAIVSPIKSKNKNLICQLTIIAFEKI